MYPIPIRQPWYPSSKVLSVLKDQEINGFMLVEGNQEDYHKVKALYDVGPINQYGIEKVQIIHNPTFTSQFESGLATLNEKNNLFNATWPADEDSSLRRYINNVLKQITLQHKSTYPLVNFLPSFRGTKSDSLESTLQKGYADQTDSGTFGKGVYCTRHANHAYQDNGTLLFNWVAFHSAYPVTISDMSSNLQGHSIYVNFDALYVLVAPKDNLSQGDYPIASLRIKPTHDEVVIFNPLHVFPRYLITLAPCGINLKSLDFQSPKNRCLHTLQGHTHDVQSMTELSNKMLASFSSDGTIKLWDPKTGMCHRTLEQHNDQVTTVTQLKDGRLVSASWDEKIIFWNPDTGFCLGISQQRTRRSLIELKDGIFASIFCTWIELFAFQGVISFPQGKLTGHTDVIYKLLALNDGILASASRDQTIKLWDPSSKTCICTLAGHKGAVLDIIQLVDGKLASASWDKTIKFWDLKTGDCIHTLYEPTAELLAQLKDGTLVSGGKGAIKLWDLKKYALMDTLQGGNTWIKALIPLSNGTFASAYKNDTTIKIWG
jgi:WD domain, G-beta repeat